MGYLFAIAAIIIIAMVTSNLSKGTKAEDGDFVLRAIATKGRDYVPIILEKVKRPLSGNVVIPSGVTVIGYEVFKDMNNITGVNIHEKVKTIGQRSFNNCSNISSLYTGEGVENIADEAFKGCVSIKELKIGPRTKEIQSNAFSGCTNIQSITIESLSCPDIFTTTFEDNIKNSCILLVPKGCIENYSNAPGWKQFKNIEEFK